MKKKLVVALISAAMVTSMLGACGSSNASSSSASSTATSSVSASSASEEDTTAASSSVSASSASEEVSADADQEAADKVAALIDAIYVQERNDNTDEQCKEAKEAWDALTDAQKELVEGENADPDYFGRDTGDASKDDPLNGDEIGENELLVVSFGTSFNDSRAEDIGGVEKALQAAYPDWSVRRAFTAQIIINHVQARDDEKIDNVDQALERAVSNGVKKLIIQPTHLMHGAEYDELSEAVASYSDKFESVSIAEPLLGEVGSADDSVNSDKEAVAKAVTAEAVKTARVLFVHLIRYDGQNRNHHRYPFPKTHIFPSYLVIKRDKRHWRAVSSSHSTCFPRHSGILGKSPRRHSRKVSVMRSSSRLLRAVRTVPEQAVEASQ